MALLVQCQSLFKLFYVYIGHTLTIFVNGNSYRHQGEHGTEKAVMTKSLLMV